MLADILRMNTMATGLGVQWRIFSAALIATVAIIGAYALARGVGQPSHASASAETELLASVAAKDTDADGLRDWEEALYGTDPRVADTRKLGMSDGQAVAKGLIVPIAPLALSTGSSTALALDPSMPVPAEGTLTRAVAANLYKVYLESLAKTPDGTLTTAQIQAMTDSVVDNLNASIAPAADFKTRADITVSGSGPEAMKAYAAAAEAVMHANKSSAKKTDFEYLSSALQDGDQEALQHLASIAKMFKSAAVGLAVLPVPVELAAAHLELVNSFARLGAINEDFTRTDTDPVAALMALKQYPAAAQQFVTAFASVTNVFVAHGVTLAPGEPGAGLVNLVPTAAKQQAAATKK